MSNRPKIFLLGPTAPYRGGIADTQAAFARALEALNVDVTLINFKKLYPSFLFPGKSQFVEQPSPLAQPQSHRLLHTYNPLNWLKVARWINRQQPDYVVFRYWTPLTAPCWWGIRLFLSATIKTIGLVDNWEPHEKRWSDRALNVLFKKSCDGFATLSERVAHQIKKETSKPVWTGFHPIHDKLPKAVDQLEARQRLGLPQNRKIAAFVGLVRPYKGVELLIEAFALTQKQTPKLFLLIAGEFYTPLAPYQKLIAEYNLQEHLCLMPEFLSSDTLRDAVCAADFICQPYKKATQSGITPLAYAYKRPLIVSDVDGLSKPINTDRSGRVVAGDAQLWAEALTTFTETSVLEHHRQQIQKAIPNYSWSRFAKNFITALAQSFA